MFAFGDDVVRLRRGRVSDPYNPGGTLPGPWDDAERITLEGVSVASRSSTPDAGPTRRTVTTEKSLYCDPDDDVADGDRIVHGRITFEVEAVPAVDRNPFTGSRPVQEVHLKEVRG